MYPKKYNDVSGKNSLTALWQYFFSNERNNINADNNRYIFFERLIKMKEKIPFDDNSIVGGAGSNDPMALLIMHKAWREIFDDENARYDNEQENEKGWE